MLEQALKYAEHVPVFPLNPNTKIPLKGSSGFKDATQDTEQIEAWWGSNSRYNVATVPSESNIFVFDIDLPNGIQTLENNGMWQRLAQEKHSFQGYKTWSGGMHLWFKTKSEIIMKQSRIDLWKDVDILSVGGVIAPPSVVKGKSYNGNLDIGNVPEAPEWLETMIEDKINNQGAFVADYKNIKKSYGKSYTGNLLDRVVTGTNKGNRNQWLTSVTGSLFNTGMKPSNILLLLMAINQSFISPSLPEKEVERVFFSIAKREARGGN